MKNQIRQLKDTLRHIGGQSIAMALFVFLVTILMTIYVGSSFYAKEKTVLRQQGELNAKEATMEYDECLLTRVNIVTVVGYVVDQMLWSGAENSEIENYLTQESAYIGASLDPSSTGLYGWINGEYLDGAGYFSSLNGDLRKMLAKPSTKDFIQIATAPLKLRRELQGINFLTTLEIEHAILMTGGRKVDVIEKLLKDGYSVDEIDTALKQRLETRCFRIMSF